ncbi:MAG TPA: disulfide bond formation protein B [Gammaproteobacteria bacterium]|nr:disulfide bond formation protein B [Gammaproteobacteria bacterium]
MSTPHHRRLPASRLLNGAGLLTTLAAMLFAVLYLERTLGLEPCPLCIVDRLIILSMGALFLLALLHNPGRRGQRVYAGLNLALALAGIATAGRHIWLQHLPPERVPECGASLEFMLEHAPLPEVLDYILQGSGECAAIQWSFLGLSIPEQTLLLFAALAALALIQLLRTDD